MRPSVQFAGWRANCVPVMLDDLGLAAAIEWQAKEFQQRTGIAMTMDIMVEDVGINKETSTQIFRIFQEILTNIARHAGATSVEGRLEPQEKTLVLRVTDNGCGFAAAGVSKSTGLGILGMEERARRVGGSVDIRSSPGQGTTVIVIVPIQEAI